MIKRFSYYLLILTILGGCALLQAKREVLENTFYSSYPEIQIKIGSEFEYIGETKEAETRQYRDLVDTTTVRKNWYLFFQTEEQRVKKGVIIQIQKAPVPFTSDIYGRVENYHDRGSCKLGGLSWQYCSFLIYPNMSSAAVRFVSDQGYVIPQCVLAKEFSKVCGPKGNYAITISYLEVPPTWDHACLDWEPNSSMTYRQRMYVERFKKNSETSFKIIK